MSILTTNHFETHTNPSNNSPSKAQFSFNKEARFDRSYKEYNPSPNRNACYHDGEKLNKQSTLSKQNGKFNARKKLDDVFVEINRQQVKNPSAFHYNLPSVFKDARIKHKHAESTIKSPGLNSTQRSFNGKDTSSLSLLTKRMGVGYDAASFGAPRESYNNVVGPTGFSYLPKKPSEPGPHSYITKHPFKELGSVLAKKGKYSIQGCRQEIFAISKTPGPGTYEPASPRVRALPFKQDINSKASLNNTSRIPMQGYPGPSFYNHSIDFASSQRNFTDVKPNYCGNRFGGDKREVFNVHKTRITPGPGEYLAPSIFGQYMDKSHFSMSMDFSPVDRTPRSLNSNRSNTNVGNKSNRSLTGKRSKSKMALTLNPMGILQSSEMIHNLGSTGNHSRTYDQILEQQKNINFRQSARSKPTSAQKTSKKRRNKLNQSHNGIMGSIKEGVLFTPQNQEVVDNFGQDNMIDALNAMQIQQHARNPAGAKKFATGEFGSGTVHKKKKRNKRGKSILSESGGWIAS